MACETQTSGPGHHGGLFESIRTLAATLLSIAHTRLDLFSTELEEERVRLTSMLVWGLAGVFCAGLGTLFATLFVVLALWDTSRLLAVGIPASLYLLGAALAWLIVRAKARSKPRLFAASLAELSKDREQLTSRS